MACAQAQPVAEEVTPTPLAGRWLQYRDRSSVEPLDALVALDVGGDTEGELGQIAARAFGRVRRPRRVERMRLRWP